MAGFLTPDLDLRFIDGGMWEVTKPYEYCIGDADSSRRVRIPAGFKTDFASIPQVLRGVLPPTGTAKRPYGRAAVVHDWLYQKRRISYVDDRGRVFAVTYCDRETADNVLREAMEVLGVPGHTRWVIYRGVRVGGWVPWNNYREEENRAAQS